MLNMPRPPLHNSQVDETFGVEFSSAEEKVHYSDYKNLSNLEGHRYKKKGQDSQLKFFPAGTASRRTRHWELPSTLSSSWCSSGKRSEKSIVTTHLPRHGGYFGPKETPYAAVLSAQEKLIAGVIVHLQVTLFAMSVQ